MHSITKMIERMGFVPERMILYTGHPDIVLLHPGMEKPFILSAVNRSHGGSERNCERAIQEWTNYDLKEWVQNISAAGSETVLSITRGYAYDKFHHEFFSDHKELFYKTIHGDDEVLCLKRFKDGIYYEDFLLEKVKQTLTDYEFDGIHFADIAIHDMLYECELSTDMMEQFMEHTGLCLPAALNLSMGDDTPKAIKLRGDWMWNNLRTQWIEFNIWRWTGFWRKICEGLHSIGKKVYWNNVWFSEPFEAMYRFGIDYKKIFKAGLDGLIPTYVPYAHLMISNKSGHQYDYHRISSMAMFLSAHSPENCVIPLLGVKDAVEEWDNIRDFSSGLERDIWCGATYFRVTKNGLKRFLDGRTICLGDGIWKDEWDTIREYTNAAHAQIPERILAPALVWSDHAVETFLPQYETTRRYSTHKMYYSLAEQGAIFGATVRTEDLAYADGPLFIPNFDMMSVLEQNMVASYKKGAVICTAGEKFNPDAYGIKPDIFFVDDNVRYKNCAFAFNFNFEDKESVLELLKITDNSPDIESQPFYAKEPINPNFGMLFSKVSEGFLKAVTALINLTVSDIVTVTNGHGERVAALPAKMKDGSLRIFVPNERVRSYMETEVKTQKGIIKVNTLSAFPDDFFIINNQKL